MTSTPETGMGCGRPRVAKGGYLLPGCAPSCPEDGGLERSATPSAACGSGGFLLPHPHLPIPLQPLLCKEKEHIVDWEPSRPVL